MDLTHYFMAFCPASQGATLTLKCRESEDNAPSVKSQGRTISKKTISDLAATEKIGLRLSRKRKNLLRKPAGVFEIKIFDQISLSSLSRHLRVKLLFCNINDPPRLFLYIFFIYTLNTLLHSFF